MDSKAFDTEDDYIKAVNNMDDQTHLGGVLYKIIHTGNLKIGISGIRDFISKRLREELEALGASDHPQFNNRMYKIMSLYDLSEDEIILLNFIFCLYSSGNMTFSSSAENIGFIEFIKFISVCTNLPLSIVKKHLTREGRLYQSRIIKYINPNYSDYISLDNFIEEYILGFTDITFIDNYIEVDKGDSYDLTTFSVETISRNIIQSLLSSQSPCNLLFYGVAGTGKTEFARSIVRSLKRKLLLLKHGQNEQRRIYGSVISDASERINMLTIINKLLTAKDGVLIIDEADFLLNTRSTGTGAKTSPEKGWLNSFLDNSNAKIIWISNDVSSMEESTLRRFSYSLYFKEFTVKERESIWNVILKKSPIAPRIGNGLLKTLSSDYRVNAGGISSSIDTLSLYLTSRESSVKYGDDCEPVIRDILSRHEKLIHGEYANDEEEIRLNAISESYDLSILNTDFPTDSLLNSLESYASHIRGGPGNPAMCINVLFWGLPGTGKTEFVKYTAKKINLPLIIKRYSDLESPFIGECEKNIKKAFQEARKKNAILFIDEADSFFTSRENAHRSWEVSRTNEFLTQMENHTGVFVCCTNLLPNLDNAFMRRFSWKVEFKPLMPASKLIIYSKYFNLKSKPLTSSQQDQIRNLPGLTPGDIKSVWQRLFFSSEQNCVHDRIINELKKETEYKDIKRSKTIGF